jgi:putative PIN family toxin of toxin-antitoxin system
MRISKTKVVLDTNIIISSILPISRYSVILDNLVDGNYELILSTSIIMEYEEKLQQIFDKKISNDFFKMLEHLDNIVMVNSYFELNLIPTDPDDNKFVDVAFAGNAHLLVTNDRHFNILKTIDYPNIQTVNIDEFIMILNEESFSV